MSKHGGCLANIFKLLLVCVIAFYAAFHIGGRSMPFQYWSGYGRSENVTNPSTRFRNGIFGDPINQTHAKRVRRAHFLSRNEHCECLRLPD